MESNSRRTYLVTGASGVIGSAAAERLRQMGHTVIGTSRHGGTPLLRPLDVCSSASIEAFAQRLEQEGLRLDGILHNAGTIARHYSQTPEGFERVTATNYLGPFRLTLRLLHLLNPDASVVCTVSLSCYVSHLNRSFFRLTPSNYGQIAAYADSKMALMLFAEELHRRHGRHLRVNVTDPGVVDSPMLHLGRWFDPLADRLFRPFCKNGLQGALPAVNALTSDASMQLFRAQRHQPIPRRWQRPADAEWLWQETERLLRL